MRLSLRCLHTFFIVLVAGLFACSGKYNSEVNFNVGEPLRVAVMPFARVNMSGKIVPSKESLFLDKVNSGDSNVENNVPEFIRTLVQTELRNSGLDVVEPFLINVELPHHGFVKKSGSLDLKKIFSTPPSELCSHFITCDAVLFGRVTDWDRNYFAIQSVNTVGVDLQLVSARTGKVLFRSTAKDSESRGITKGPTGISDLVLEPIKGLDIDVIEGLSRKVVRKMLLPLMVENRPEFLAAELPSIYAVSHDASTGILKPSGHLTVLMFASPKMTASFSIGERVLNVPMVEKSPGDYVGDYYPLQGSVLNSEEVSVSLVDRFGRTTSKIINRPPLSLID